MTRTKALVVVGCIMLALAVMAALELTQEPLAPVEGQIVTGAISTVPPVRLNNDAPTAPLGGDVPPGVKEENSSKPTGLISLEPGTLRPENEVAPPAQASAPPEQVDKELASTPEQAPAEAPVVLTQVKPAPEKVQTQPAAKPDPVESKAVGQAPAAKPAPEKAPAKPEAQAKAEAPAPAEAPAKASPKGEAPVKAPAKAETPAKAESQTKPAAEKKSEPASASKSREPQAIDTAGPAKIERGQKAIVWTRLELSGKGIVFRISGADKLEGKAFILPDPQRYVVDLQGEWAMRLPTVPANAFVKKIRYGKQEDNTRMVIDLDGEKKCQMVRINPTTLEFRVNN